MTPVDLEALIAELPRQGFTLVGPTIRDGAVVLAEIDGLADLPKATTVRTEPGHCQLAPRSDQAYFGYWTTAQGLKRFLHPPVLRTTAAVRHNGTFQILEEETQPPRYAFLGIRSCDLAALAILDRVLLNDRYCDQAYAANRQGHFVIAIQCLESAPTCFCESLGTGPTARHGFDLALTEVINETDHYFWAEAATSQGLDALTTLGFSPLKGTIPRHPPGFQSRAVQAEEFHRAVDRIQEHPRWDETAARCLTCANCTMVCPTCFCVNTTDTSNVSQTRAERWRSWDSCFTQGFTYIHGGSVRLSAKSRYRHWLSHKLGRWQDQFGMPGCTGCGRCIAWCPVGIDITAEVAALTAPQ